MSKRIFNNLEAIYGRFGWVIRSRVNYNDQITVTVMKLPSKEYIDVCIFGTCCNSISRNPISNKSFLQEAELNM